MVRLGGFWTWTNNTAGNGTTSVPFGPVRFRGWTSDDDVVVPPTPDGRPYPGPAGAPAGRRRKQYIIGNRRVALSPVELARTLQAMLTDPPKAVVKKVKAEQRAAQKAEPKTEPVKQRAATYAAAPLFDWYWPQPWVQDQPEVAEALRAMAYALEIEDEERLIEMLLLEGF